MEYAAITLLGAAAAVTAETALQEAAGIMETEDWNTLKGIWHRMNSAGIPQSRYQPALTSEKGDSLAAGIQRLFSGLALEDPAVARALDMVVGMAVRRAYGLSRIDPSMLTRMMPAWTTTVREDLLFDFETRVQTLAELLAEGEISATEFTAARDSLLDKALVISLLEHVEESYEIPLYMFPVYDLESIQVDTILRNLELSYQLALDTLAKEPPSEYAGTYEIRVKQYEEFLTEYQEFQEAEPVYRMLLADLMEARR